MNQATGTKVAATKTRPYSVADYLDTPEAMAAYLDAWLEDAPDDPAGIARALGDIARAKGMSQLAKGWATRCSRRCSTRPPAATPATPGSDSC